MGTQRKRYRAFISYTQHDKAIARRVHRALETYRVPKEVNAPVGRDHALGRFFLDNDEMGASQSLGAALEEALDDSENLIVICSPSASQSKWVDAEVRHFKARGNARVFAVIAAGEPHADDPSRECFTPSLKVTIDAHGKPTEEPDEPRAPNLQQDGMQRVRAQLAAGLLNVSFDELWQRDRRRAWRRRLLTWATVSLVISGSAFLINQAWLATAGLTYQDERARVWAILGMVIEPNMIPIPAGSFLFGTPPVGAEFRDDKIYVNEAPNVTMTIPAPFLIGRFEVTFAEYDVFALSTGRQLPDDEGYGRGRHPVINVLRVDAQAYVAWLAEKTGKAYRLPTEVEWEYVARGGSIGRYWWCSAEAPICEIPPDYARCNGCTTKDDVRGPDIVGRFPANKFGVFDTAGNVWEWVSGCYQQRLDAAVQTAHDEKLKCSLHTARGGSWRSSPQALRVTSRTGYKTDVRNDFIGFRVAQSFP